MKEKSIYNVVLTYSLESEQEQMRIVSSHTSRESAIKAANEEWKSLMLSGLGWDGEIYPLLVKQAEDKYLTEDEQIEASLYTLDENFETGEHSIYKDGYASDMCTEISIMESTLICDDNDISVAGVRERIDNNKNFTQYAQMAIKDILREVAKPIIFDEDMKPAYVSISSFGELVDVYVDKIYLDENDNVLVDIYAPRDTSTMVGVELYDDSLDLCDVLDVLNNVR